MTLRINLIEANAARFIVVWQLTPWRQAGHLNKRSRDMLCGLHPRQKAHSSPFASAVSVIH